MAGIRSLLSLPLAGLVLLMPIRAMADVIDGDWCFPDGRRFEIRGPDIVTPAGSRTMGDYSRHHFIYVVPQTDPDPDAGKTIDMRLMNENTVYLWVGGPDSETEAPPQIWHRCLPAVSLNDFAGSTAG